MTKHKRIREHWCSRAITRIDKFILARRDRRNRVYRDWLAFMWGE
jgi:uncharacterized Zn finger protein